MIQADWRTVERCSTWAFPSVYFRGNPVMWRVACRCGWWDETESPNENMHEALAAAHLVASLPRKSAVTLHAAHFGPWGDTGWVLR